MSGVVRVVMESAVKIGRLALEAIDVDGEQIDRAEDMYRARDKERLRALYEAGGDMRAARDRIITSDEREALGAATERHPATAEAEAAVEELGRGQEP